MFLAAVYDEWDDKQIFIMLTRTTVPPLDQVHQHQPVFLASALEADLWISRGDLPGLDATPAVAWHPLDARMGNPKAIEEWVTKRVSVSTISSFFSKAASAAAADQTQTQTREREREKGGGGG